MNDLVDFVRRHRWAVQASVDASGSPQAAVIGVAVTDAFELVFDTLGTSRKCRNLRQTPRIALVVGWDEAQTLQLEGIADEPSGDELARIKQAYFATFPDGREREGLEAITYFRVRPTWSRLSDFRDREPRIVEMRHDR